MLSTKVTCKEEVRANVQKEEEVENVEFSSSTYKKKSNSYLPSHVTTFKKLVFTLFDLVPRRTRWIMTRVPVIPCTKKIYWKFSSIIILKRRLFVSQLPMVSVDSRLYTVHSNQESSLRVNLMEKDYRNYLRMCKVCV